MFMILIVTRFMGQIKILPSVETFMGTRKHIALNPVLQVQVLPSANFGEHGAYSIYVGNQQRWDILPLQFLPTSDPRHPILLLSILVIYKVTK
jgi:hypothetical protein